LSRTGYIFFNQVPTFNSYTLDFYFAEFRLAVEVDGKYFHDVLSDADRDDVHRREFGIETLRFPAREVSDDSPGVLPESGRPFSNATGLLFRLRKIPQLFDGVESFTGFL
jgi:very-short-patch-repair endonuclease